MDDLLNLHKPGFTLVLGGQRSGKSLFAESIVENVGGGYYVATTEIHDDEMAARVISHKERRGDQWQTIEEPVLLVETLLSLRGGQKPALVECLTLWLSNIMVREKDIEKMVDELCVISDQLDFPVVFVSSEVGQGIIPDNELARSFIDYAGKMNQKIADVADHVIFVTSGIPQILK
jgi:adenosylcobinamide kinase/adenosylcobinamide-phosphate guanylyltransferase